MEPSAHRSHHCTDNNTRETATDLSHLAGTPLSAINGLGIAGDADWYRIEVSPGEEELHIVCSFQHAGGDIDLALFDAAGALVRFSGSITDNEEIRTPVPTAGSYYIRVIPRRNSNSPPSSGSPAPPHTKQAGGA